MPIQSSVLQPELKIVTLYF